MPLHPRYDFLGFGADLPTPTARVPSWPRLWNHWMGGKDAYEVDRTLIDLVESEIPPMAALGRHRRAIRTRLVRHLVADTGIDQLLVAGCDLPVGDDVHDIAQRINPDTRIVYANQDPHVMAHARGLMSGTRSVAHIDAAVGDPAALLAGASRTLDLSRPVGVLLINALDLLNRADALLTAGTLRRALTPGSRLGLAWLGDNEAIRALPDLCRQHNAPVPTLRTRHDIEELMTGLDPVEPGIVPAPRWRPELRDDLSSPVELWCAVGRVPAATLTPKGDACDFE